VSVKSGFPQNLVEDDLGHAVEDVLDQLRVRGGRLVRVDAPPAVAGLDFYYLFHFLILLWPMPSFLI
jgi:hypothetical protein